MTRNEIIKNTAVEIMALAEYGAIDAEVLELMLQSMALELNNLAFLRHMDALDGALMGGASCKP